MSLVTFKLTVVISKIVFFLYTDIIIFLLFCTTSPFTNFSYFVTLSLFLNDKSHHCLKQAVKVQVDLYDQDSCAVGDLFKISVF